MVDKLLIALLMLFFFQTALSSQTVGNDDYNVKILSNREGLPYENVEDIFQDSDGFLWLSMFGGGVARYDGNSFIPFNTRTTPELYNDRVAGVCQDMFGRIWIASSDGINVLDTKTLEFLGTDPHVEAVSRGHLVNEIASSADGCIWFNSLNSLFRVAFTADGSVERVDSLDGSENDMGLRPSFKDVDGDGSMWTSIDREVYKVSYSEGMGLHTYKVDMPELETGNKTTSFLREKNMVWIGTQSGLYRIDRMSGTVRLYRHDCDDEHSLSNNHVNALALTSDGRVVVGTMKGLSIYDPQGDRFIVYNSDVNEYGSKYFRGNVIRSLITVGEQIWIGTDTDGITVLKKKRLPVSEIQHRENDNTSLQNSTISALCFDHNGVQWIGTVEDGLYRTIGDGYRYKNYTEENSALCYNSVNSLCEDAYGTLWVGTMYDGINLIDTDNPDRVRKFNADPEVLSQIDNATAMAYDHINDCMWICSRTGLFRYAYKSGTLSQFSSEHKLCFGITMDSKDRMLVTCQDGLLCIDLKTMETREYSQPGLSMSALEDADGNIWIASFDNGLFKAVENQGELSFEQMTMENGLADNRLRALLLDGNSLWVTTVNGLSRVNTKNSSIESYSAHDGIVNTCFRNNAACVGPDKSLYFGQSRGLTVLRSRFVPPVLDVNARIMLTGMFIGDNAALISDVGKTRIREKDRNVSFRFADLSFEDSDRVKYLYRIIPKDEDWQTADGETKLIRYATLPGGNLTLQLKAVDSSGNVLSEDACDIYVKPYFYRSIWFFLLLIVLAAGLTCLIMRAKTQILRQNARRLKLEVEKQTSLLSEQNRKLEAQAMELSEQNRILMKKNEALAGRKMITDNTPAEGAPVRDAKFIEKIMEVIRGLYKDPDLDVNAFCEAMCMSRSVLNKKVQDSFNQSIGQFIRTYRLNVAKEMLENKTQDEMNVSDVAYEVGFNDPKYFTRCFSKEFGIAPSYLQGAISTTDEADPD